TRRRARRSRLLVQRALAAFAAVALLALVLGLVFAGSSQRLASGVRIAGVDVGGLSPDAARHKLEARARAVAHVPVLFTAAGHSGGLGSGRCPGAHRALGAASPPDRPRLFMAAAKPAGTDARPAPRRLLASLDRRSFGGPLLGRASPGRRAPASERRVRRQ